MVKVQRVEVGVNVGVKLGQGSRCILARFVCRRGKSTCGGVKSGGGGLLERLLPPSEFGLLTGSGGSTTAPLTVGTTTTPGTEGSLAVTFLGLDFFAGCAYAPLV